MLQGRVFIQFNSVKRLRNVNNGENIGFCQKRLWEGVFGSFHRLVYGLAWSDADAKLILLLGFSLISILDS